MNSYLPGNGAPFPRFLLPNGQLFTQPIPLTTAQNVQLPTTTQSLHNQPPQITHPLQPNPVQMVTKALQFGILQQKFIQRFSFNNSNHYHPHCVPHRGGSGDSNRPNSKGGYDLTFNNNNSVAQEELIEIEEEQLSEEDMAGKGKKRPFTPGGGGGGHPQYGKRSRGQHEQYYYQDGYNVPTHQRFDAHRKTKGPLNHYQYQQATEIILQHFRNRKQPYQTYLKKMQLRDALYAVVKGVFPYCGLYVVGSSMNGFGNVWSDMDMCLMISHEEIDQKKEATEVLRILFKALKKCTFLREMTLIKAKVPILKFHDQINNVECDLNINNPVGIRNTHLLNSYSKMDNRLAPLVIYVKHWAKYNNINDAREGTISSYSLCLMIIHFLQFGVHPSVLPSLQQMYPHKFTADIDIRLLTLNEKLPPFTSPNKESVGELFVGFLHYYANLFRFDHEAISIRLGRTIPVQEVRRQSPDNNYSQWKYLCIEEPFDRTNTSRSVYDPCVFQRILRVFRISYNRVRSTGDIRSICMQPN